MTHADLRAQHRRIRTVRRQLHQQLDSLHQLALEIEADPHPLGARLHLARRASQLASSAAAATNTLESNYDMLASRPGKDGQS